jgi:acyl-CoA thioester hydrolase
MGNGRHSGETAVRVRYGEVDRMGVVHHSHYLAYFEQGRTELLRSFGTSYRELEDSGTLLVVVESGLRFLKPAAYDDLLTVRTRLVSATGVRLRFEYEVLRDGSLLATGFTVLASTDRTGRPRRPPAPFRELLGEPAEPPAADPGKSRAAGAVQGRRP